MELQQAAGYFNTVPIAGYTGSAWVSNVASGDFLTYDRFLGPRTFGHLQRMFHIAGNGSAVMPYEVVRTPDSKVYLVASYNHDVRGTEAYATSFLFQEAFYTVGIVDMQTTSAPSGIGGTLDRVVSHTYHGHMDRYTSEASTEVDTVRYGTHIIQLPLSAMPHVTADSELLIDGVYFEVKEVTRVLNTTEIRALERGTSV